MASATPVEAVLRRVSMFDELPDDALAILAAGATVADYNEGDAVFLEGDPASGMYIVDQGWVHVVRGSAQGREQVLQFVGPGEVFNPLGAFSARPNPATATALEPSRIVLVPRPLLLAILKEQPGFAARIVEDMADRLVYLVDLDADLSLRSVASRFARLLLDSAEDGIVVRQRWLTLAEIAARLGTVADVIQRAVAKLESDGVIEVDRREIRIIDERRLRELAG